MKHESYIPFAFLVLEVATRANFLYVVLEQPYLCRCRPSRTGVIFVYTLPSRLTQISTPVETPRLVGGGFPVDMAFDAKFSAVALPLLYFSWALSSSGDQ